MTKSNIVWMKLPYFTRTSFPAGSAPRLTARSLKLMPPMSLPRIGMMMSPTSEETILPKATPTMTPTARSTTLPFMANSLNSEARLMRRPPCIRSRRVAGALIGDSYRATRPPGADKG